MFAEVLLPEENDSAYDGAMPRMPLLEHLEELRARILRALYGFLAILTLCVAASDRLFEIVMAPGYDAMNRTGIAGAGFIAVGVMEKFQIIWVKAPLVAAIFLASPWILWQAWAFVSPGLYPREKRWAIPFMLAIASLFLLGGCFGYFVAFRYGMTFLLGIGKDTRVLPLISIADYFDRLVDILLGIGVAFELPVVMVLLTLIRVASPSFLLKHSNYAILGIVILAALVTPTQDAFNLVLFAAPMCALFFLGVLLSYVVVRKRNRQWPFRQRAS